MFALFAMLYFVQGVITSYQLNFFKPHMDSEGIDANRIGLVASIALLPFIIKFLFGLLSDKFNLFGFGHRVPYMILGVSLCSLAFFVAFFVDVSANFWVVATMVLAATFAMALFDTTADAYAVESIPPEDHSRVQSAMTGGRAAGLIILSFVFGILASRYGYSSIFLAISVILLLPLVMLFQVKEPDKRSEIHQFDWGAFRVLLQPSYLLFGLFLTLAWFMFQGIDGLVTFFMSSSLGAAETSLGTYGTLKGVGMVVGALGVSLVATRFSLRAAGLITLSLVTIGGLLLSTANSVTMIVALGVLMGVVAGAHWTVYATIAMGITDLRIAGSMFALFQMMANIGLAAGEGIATSLTDNIGFSAVFSTLALANIILIPFFIFVYSRLRNVAPAGDTPLAHPEPDI